MAFWESDDIAKAFCETSFSNNPFTNLRANADRNLRYAHQWKLLWKSVMKFAIHIQTQNARRRIMQLAMSGDSQSL
jgi:hypothetical protein